MNAHAQTRPRLPAPRAQPASVLACFLVLLAVAPLLPEFYVTLLNYIGLSALVASGWCC
jgi:branched-chain amino acid transport system permease protein